MLPFPQLVYGVFGVVLIALVALQTRTDMLQALSRNADFSKFQRAYLAVFLSAMTADWLQGPYLYHLYEQYGYLHEQIAALYVCGYVSAALTGPILAAFADRVGRRKMVLVFCGLASISCLFKLSSSFFALLAGRVFAGMASTLLATTFEAWMVHEHRREGFPSDWIARTFSVTTFGNGIVAALAGVLAWAVTGSNGQYAVRPFLLAVLFLAAAAFFAMRWRENDVKAPNPGTSRLGGSLRAIGGSKSAFLLAVVQCFFESALHLFVFLWHPSLAPADAPEHAPLGFIFGAFMLATMLGSCLFRAALMRGWSVTRVLGMALVTGGCALALPMLLPSQHRALVFAAFVLFEVAVGAYYPAVATLRAELIPDEYRASMAAWFRVPLCVLVALILLLVGWVPSGAEFALCAGLCGVAWSAHTALAKELRANLVPVAMPPPPPQQSKIPSAILDSSSTATPINAVTATTTTTSFTTTTTNTNTTS